MNIFYLDNNPKTCARYHCDKHVVKMILETAQLLCGAHWATGGEAQYKPTHLNHPCAIWTRKSLSNYKWLCELGFQLCLEYTRRYGKQHKTQDVIVWCCDNHPEIEDNGYNKPPLAMPDECKIGNNPMLSYRNYYMKEKRDFCTWKNMTQPYWFK